MLGLVIAASFSSGWVLRDAQARGIPTRKAFTWAALQFVEFPVFLWLYRRIRPRRRLDAPSIAGRLTNADSPPFFFF